MELEEQAFPIEEQAMEGFKRNLDLALRLGIDNEWVRKSRDVLIKLFPDTARIKESERQAVASNDFFYTFKGTKEKDDEVRIDGYRVVYVKTPYRVENIEERYKIAARWTKRQRKVVFAQDMETPVILIEGKPVELRGIRELWAKHYHN
jgi:hypothetical protein